MVSQTYIFYKILNGFAPKYLTNYLNINDYRAYNTRASEHNNIKWFGTRTENFKESFFPSCVNKWYKLDISLRKAENIKRFKSMLKDFFNLKQKSLFTIHDPRGVKLLSRLRTARKISKYGAFSGPYFPVFSPNTGKYGPELNSVFRHFLRSDG